MKNSFGEIEKRVIEFRDARDWKQFHNPKDLALSVTLEASELMEHFQWKSPEEVKAYAETHKEDLSEEMADVAIYLITMAHDLNINLLDAIDEKLNKNNAKYEANKSKGNHKKYTEL